MIIGIVIFLLVVLLLVVGFSIGYEVARGAFSSHVAELEAYVAHYEGEWPVKARAELDRIISEAREIL